MINGDGIAGIRAGSPAGAYLSGLDENYQELATAIIRQAVRDYEDVLLRLFARPMGTKKEELEAEKSELEVFFHSELYAALTEIDGDQLIGAARRHAVERAKESIKRRQKKRLKDMGKPSRPGAADS